MKRFKAVLSVMLAALMALPPGLPAANHREAPITALDRTADIADYFSFVSYDNPNKVTFILTVDPLLEPGNGPNYFPFDPEILYEVKIDNDHDAVEDIVFQWRFQTELRGPGVFTGFVGAGSGIVAPANSPAPVAPGTPIVPPAITALDGPGSQGLLLRQTYSVTMKRMGRRSSSDTDLGFGKKLIAVPTNVGPRTMPAYTDLAKQGTYELDNGIRVFAGTIDDPFWIDLGAAFDSLNFRATGFVLPGVLTDAQETNDNQNFAADDVSGYNVNCIAIEVPITMLTSDGLFHTSGDPQATIGSWGTTSRPRVSIRREPNQGNSDSLLAVLGPQRFVQIQRMGNPLINELLVGTGSKDRFSMDQPKNDAQFANFFLDPLLARVLNAVYGGLPIPEPPRRDLLPLVTYAAPIAAPGTPTGPVADLLRLNTGITPTPAANRKRMAVLAGDLGGFPNGRRVSDDVTDIAARAVAGILKGGAFGGFPYNRIGDGVNTNDAAYQETFPYVAFALDGRTSRPKDPGEPGGGPIN